MRLPYAIGGAMLLRLGHLACCAVVVAPLLALGCGRALAATESPSEAETVLVGIESEAASDAAVLPAIPMTLTHEWRSFDRNGSARGAFIDILLVVAVALVALLAERAVARVSSWRTRRAIRTRPDSPTLAQLLALLLWDAIGVVVFLAVFVAARRHLFVRLDVTAGLAILAVNVLLRWRVVALVVAVVLRPGDPAARLIDVSDREARRLARFVSVAILAMIVITGFARYGLIRDAGAAAHMIGFISAMLTCALYVAIVFRARAATEALIRGHDTAGIVAAVRAGLARAWLAIALSIAGILIVVFVTDLSLGLLSYYHAVTATLGVMFLLIVLERVAERAWHRTDDTAARDSGALVAQALHHMLRAAGLLVAAIVVARIWADAAHLGVAETHRALRSADSALLTLFLADAIWQAVRLTIEGHLAPTAPAGLSGDLEEGEGARASRLQTALPFLRAALAITIAILAVLVILSRLGVDTAPLIAGAGVFGLAISFGSQSLVRDIISGLLYMWDDAFRVGEYIDTGRLRGTVEAMSIRSVKLRHHNGPLHTIPYGQLGAVSNMSRDWAILKFNLRLERGTDIELVRKTVKQIGIDMQLVPEIAAEVIQPLKLQGIVEFADTALVIRLKFTARPIKPSWIQREYLKRIYWVFGDKGIAFASGALTLQTVAAGDRAMPILTGSAPPPSLPVPIG